MPPLHNEPSEKSQKVAERAVACMLDYGGVRVDDIPAGEVEPLRSALRKGMRRQKFDCATFTKGESTVIALSNWAKSKARKHLPYELDGPCLLVTVESTWSPADSITQEHSESAVAPWRWSWASA